MVDHDLDEDYRCRMCNEVATKVTLNNIGALSGFTNDANNPFSIDEEGVIKTGDGQQTISTMNLVADRTMVISLQCRIEGGTSSDRWYFYLNGSIQTTFVGSSSQTNTFQIVLNEGDTLRIRYRRDSGTGFIQNFYIL